MQSKPFPSPETPEELAFVILVTSGAEAFIRDMLAFAQDKPDGYAEGFTTGVRMAVATFVLSVLNSQRATPPAEAPGASTPHGTVH